MGSQTSLKSKVEINSIDGEDVDDMRDTIEIHIKNFKIGNQGTGVTIS